MLRIYRIGAPLHQLVKNNPVLPVETGSTTNYKAILVIPKQTREIIESFANPLHRILILTCAALRSAHQNFSRCAGQTCYGTRTGLR